MMKKPVLALSLVCGVLMTASANPYLLLAPAAISGAQMGATYGPPILGATVYGICHTPPIHVFGNENTTVGLDWSSFSGQSKNVYGLQMSICGGGFAEDLYGIEMSLISCGWVDEYDISQCRMNGLEFAPFAVKTSMANGFQLSVFYAAADIVNGFQFGGFYSDVGWVRGIQCGLVNTAARADGLQLGIYNSTRRGCCLQLGLINCIKRRRTTVLPLLNIGFR